MQERPLDDPAPPPLTVPHLSPEERRKHALRWRAGLQERNDLRVGRLQRAINIVNRVWTGSWNDGFIHAGNLAYMAILALFPFFIMIAAVFSLIGEPAQRIESIHAIMAAVPPVVAGVLEPVALDVMAARSGWLLWVGGLIGMWTAGSLIETIRDILRRAYGTQQTLAFWRYRLISTGVIFAAVILLLASLLAQVVIGGAEELIAHWFPRLSNWLGTLSTTRLITAVVLFLSLHLLFLSLTPEAYRGKRYPKWPGALLVMVWWVVVSLALPGVLSRFFTYDLTYGSLAGVMIALFFFWLVGLGMVAGAELNAALAITPEERDMLGIDDDVREHESREAV